MDIVVDPGAAVPPYEQVRARIAELAAGGQLPAGARLPPVRALAAQVGLATNTVARAYRELERAGLVVTRGRHGTVVTARAAGVPAEAVELARRYAEGTAALGVDPRAAVELVRAAVGLSDGAPHTPDR